MYLYHIASISKCVLGLIILLITYSSINIYQDPGIAIGLGFIGLFILIRGLTFYIFIALYKAFSHGVSQERIFKNSYKLSFLFGIYAMLNVLLLLLGKRNKRIGLLLLAGCIALQVHLFKDTR